MKKLQVSQPVIAGWREWVAFPELGLNRVKAKVDTGARTSALHAFNIKRIEHDGAEWISFDTQPVQYAAGPTLSCRARLKDVRVVTDSGGHREQRFVIETPMKMGKQEWLIELTLTDRSKMKFRMLIGRHAMHGRLIVDPGKSFLTSRRRKVSKAAQAAK